MTSAGARMGPQIPDPYDGQLSDQWLKGYAKRRRLAKRIVDLPGAFTLLSAGSHLLRRLTRFNGLVQMVKRDAAQELSIRHPTQDRGDNPVAYGSGFGYDHETDDFAYQQEMLRDLALGARSKHRPIILEGLSEIDRLVSLLGITQTVNFGVSLAYIENELAKRHSDVQFIGIDRAPSVKTFNDNHFDRPNLSFVAGDIMDWIDEQKSLEGALFINMRTITQLPERFVRDYYARLYERGAAGVYSAEPYGIPRETDELYAMGYDHQASVHYRNNMWLHNYPEILTSSGFQVVRAEFIDVPGRDADQRTFVISAKR